jgi:hypothetical protein
MRAIDTVECRFMAKNGGSGHPRATLELPSTTDIRDRTSAFSGFRRLYPQLRTRMAPVVNGGF